MHVYEANFNINMCIYIKSFASADVRQIPLFADVCIVLQDLVEIIMGLQRSLSCAGHTVNLSEGSTVSSLLCQYASLLAAQGVLRTAVSYLNSATQVSKKTEKNRRENYFHVYGIILPFGGSIMLNCLLRMRDYVLSSAAKTNTVVFSYP